MDIPAEFRDLIERGHHPLGRPVRVDLGPRTGPLAELAALLSHTNGFTLANGGVQVFRAGDPGHGPELADWNRPGTWKDTYGGLADNLLCFGQDLFGVQFAIADDLVVTFDPETADREVIGGSLTDWACWLLSDLDVHAARSFATGWQRAHGALSYTQRLYPCLPFVLGGTYTGDNLVGLDAVTAMRNRGPLARQLHRLPDSTAVRVVVG